MLKLICFSLFIAVISLFFLSGCGGGGGGGSSIVASDPIRQIQPGDELTYQVASTSTNGNQQSYSVHWTTQADSAAPRYGGKSLLTKLELFDPEIDPNEPYRIMNNYYEQLSDGTLLNLGQTIDLTDYRLTHCINKPISCPYPLQVGKTYSYSASYADGSARNITGKVTAIETVNGYKTYKIHEVVQRSDRIAYGDRWFSPELGYVVKTDSYYEYNNIKQHEVSTLISKNF